MIQPVVIIGAGYGGLTVARQLGRALRHRPEHPVVLVDRHDYHELKPKIPEAVGEWTDCAVKVPIGEVLAGTATHFRQAEVTGLDLENHQVLTDGAPLPYWRLVWALGGQPDFTPGGQPIPGLQQHAIAPYTHGAACRLRHRLGELTRHAASLATRAERRPFLTVAVAGGGFVGVELAGELVDRLVLLATRLSLAPDEPQVILVEPHSVLLGFDPELGVAAAATLRAKGVDLRLGVGLAEAQPGRLRLTDGTVLESQTLVWAGGIRGHQLAATVGFPTDTRGRIVVDQTLRVVGRPEVYALGDSAAIPAPAVCPSVEGSGQAAIDQGTTVARSILAEVSGGTCQQYQCRSRGTVVLLGHRQAVARVGQWAPLSRLAPWLKQVPMLEHLWKLGGPRLVARHLGSTLLPLLAPGRVDRYRLAGDAPAGARSGSEPARRTA